MLVEVQRPEDGRSSAYCLQECLERTALLGTFHGQLRAYATRSRPARLCKADWTVAAGCHRPPSLSHVAGRDQPANTTRVCVRGGARKRHGGQPACGSAAVVHAFYWQQHCADGAVLLRCLSAIGLAVFSHGPARPPARRSEAAEGRTAEEGGGADGGGADGGGGGEHTAHAPARRPALKRSRIPVSKGRQAPARSPAKKFLQSYETPA